MFRDSGTWWGFWIKIKMLLVLFLSSGSWQTFQISSISWKSHLNLTSKWKFKVYSYFLSKRVNFSASMKKTFVVSFPIKSGTSKRPAWLKGEYALQRSLNPWTYQRSNKLPFFRFRHFSVSKGNSKVLDEDTPGGGLVAEFCHMVWNWAASCTLIGWQVLQASLWLVEALVTSYSLFVFFSHLKKPIPSSKGQLR